MESLTYIVENMQWFVLLIGALVFFHELGHFLVAKAFDVKVQKFSLGFGPKLIGFTRGETEYCVSLLPLGGFVKMLGEGPDNDIPPEDLPRAFRSKPLWQRSLVVLAGPVFNFVLAFFVYLAMFTGPQTFGDSRLGLVVPGEPAWRAGLRPGDKIVSAAGEPIERWGDIQEIISARPGQVTTVVYERGEESFEVELTPSPLESANVFNEKVVVGRIGISPQYLKPIVAVVDAESPAALAGVQSDDVITRVDGKKITAWHEARAALAAIAENADVTLGVRRGEKELELTLTPTTDAPEGLDTGLFSAGDTAWGYTGLVSKETIIAKIDNDTPAQAAGLQVGDRLLRVTSEYEGDRRERAVGMWSVDFVAMTGVDARSEFILTVQRGREIIKRNYRLLAREEKDDFKNVRTTYIFGAVNDANVLGTYVYERPVGLAEAAVTAVAQVGEDMTLIGKGIVKMVQGVVPIDSIGGPIMLFNIAEKSAKHGWTAFLRIMAIISVNLGLINLFPIPVLDGGHLLFFGVEALRRRPPSLRVREVANMVGLALLLMLMVLVFHNDIVRYILG